MKIHKNKYKKGEKMLLSTATALTFINIYFEKSLLLFVYSYTGNILSYI